jgi:hypothetical protein
LTGRHGAVYHKALRDWQLAGKSMKVALIIAGIVLAILVVGLVILGSVDIPAPSGQVEKVIPPEKLPH